MNVSFSPVNYNRNYAFKSTSASKKEVPHTPTKKEITDAKTKKAISECFCVVLGVAGLYMYGKVSGKKFFNNWQLSKKSEETKDLIEAILPTKDIVEKCRQQKLIKTA